MKTKSATVSLIILNALAFFAGVWAAFGSMGGDKSVGSAIGLSAVFLAAFPFPHAFVWCFFRASYDFPKKKFLLCTLLPPCIVAVALGAAMCFLGGLTGLAFSFALHAATLCLVISTAVWVSVGGALEKTSRKLPAIFLLFICGILIFGRLFGLLNTPLAIMTSTVYRKEPVTSAYVVAYVLKKLPLAGILALPIGFGASRLARVYRERYSVKAPLFMLLAFLPTLIIAGIRIALMYFADKEYYFYRRACTELFDTIILTAAVAVMTAVFTLIAHISGRRRTVY